MKAALDASYIQGIVADADRVLEIARQAQSEEPEGNGNRKRIVEAAELLEQRLLQDVERNEDDASLKEGVSRDRIFHRVTDPQMHHGHKSSSTRFDSHKAVRVISTSSQ